MGNFEKLVVLIVLFLAAVVLAVSLRDGEAAAASPLEAAQSLLEDEAAPAKTPTAPASDRPSDDEPAAAPSKDASSKTAKAGGEGARAPRPGFLLDTGDAAREAPVAPATTTNEPPLETGATDDEAPASSLDDGPVRILRTTRGLEPSALEDFMVYTVEAGDTWSSLAQRFYRDRGLAEVLGRANDDVRELVEGASILVPVYDLAREAEQREPWSSVAAPGEAAGATKDETRPIEAGSHLGATTYVVAKGDTLSGISLKVYGTAQRWKSIFEANRQRMASPDWLQVGMRLSIPQGAELDELREDLRREAQGRPRVR